MSVPSFNAKRKANPAPESTALHPPQSLPMRARPKHSSPLTRPLLSKKLTVEISLYSNHLPCRSSNLSMVAHVRPGLFVRSGPALALHQPFGRGNPPNRRVRERPNPHPFVLHFHISDRPERPFDRPFLRVDGRVDPHLPALKTRARAPREVARLWSYLQQLGARRRLDPTPSSRPVTHPAQTSTLGVCPPTAHLSVAPRPIPAQERCP